MIGAPGSPREALDRISAIRLVQPDSGEREGSQIALMHEYLRRMALWANALGGSGRPPLYGLVEQLAEHSPVVKATLEGAGVEALKNELPDLPSSMERVCAGYLAWGAIAGLAEVRAYALPEPYEPAICLFERGGYFSLENGMFQIGIASFSLRRVSDYLTRPPYIELDEASFARADEDWRKHQAELAAARTPR